MRKWKWKSSMLAMMSGMVLLQTPACAEQALYLSTVANVLTAGGVMFLVSRVLE